MGRNHRNRFLPLALLLGSWAAAGLAAQLPTVTAAKVAQAPRIDGDLSDACWQQAAKVSGFTLGGTGQPAKTPTEALLACDARALYVAFRCQEPAPEGLYLEDMFFSRFCAVHPSARLQSDRPFTARQPSSGDAVLTPFEDDVWLSVSPGEEAAAPYEFRVNPAGAGQDRRGRDPSWDGEWQAAARVGAAEWTAEIAIPWYNFALDLVPGGWQVVLGRSKATQPLENSRWEGGLASPQDELTRLTGLRVPDLVPTDFRAGKTGCSYQVEGTIENQGKMARRVILQLRDAPAAGRESRAEEALELRAGAGADFKVRLGMERLGPRRLVVRVLHPQTREVLLVTSVGAEQFPRLAQAYLDRNYYTTEQAARGIISLGVDETEGPLVAEMEIRPEGKPPIKARAAVRDTAKTIIAVPLAGIAPGKYPVVLRVLNGKGKAVVEETALLRKEPPAPAGIREVKVDRERLCALVDGMPFFPIGIYGVPPAHMKEVAQAGFNCTIRWSPGSPYVGKRLQEALNTSQEAGRKAIEEYLDACQEAGLLAIESPSTFGAGYKGLALNYRGPKFADDFGRFVDDPLPLIMETARRHPAVLAYYGPDEPGEYPVHRVSAEYSRTVAKYDPYRPNFYLFFGKVYDWTDAFDVAGIDYYPIGQLPPLSQFSVIREQAAAAGRLRIPYWHVPLCETYSGSQRGVSAAEQRIQSYLNVIGGAKGMLWWMWPPRHNDNWEELKRLAGEFKALSPILLEATPDQAIRYDPREFAGTVQVRVQEYKGNTYLIAANASEYDANVTFRLPGRFGGEASVWFEDRKLAVTQARFTDRFEGYGTHVYELRGRWPTGGPLAVTVATGWRKFPGAIPLLAGGASGKARLAGARNLLPNSGFETVSLRGWPDYWWDSPRIIAPAYVGAKDSLWGSDETVAFEGKRSLRLVKREGVSLLPAPWIPFPTAFIAYLPVRGAGSYTLSVYLKADRPNMGASLELGSSSGKVQVSTDWARYTLTAHDVAEGSQTLVQIGPLDEGTLWVDAAQLEAGDQPTEYEPTTR
ncbi:MAG: hypothetical protein HY321_20775 [Armatimonadetes bacterium]|nr:hypothetical protein [Armatimonadota bacterium]